ncbi:MAG: ABC transporter ATP-binding protein [Bacillota bacterium]
MTICTLKKVSKTYFGGEEVSPVRGIELEINSGDFLSIEGPSGSGKSTLLYLIGGLLKPTEGNVLIRGQNTQNLKERELTRLRSRNIGFVFQEGSLFPALTALENVELAYKLQDKSRRDGKRNQKAKELLATFGLKERFDFLPHQLSVGQRRRVLVARAFVKESSLILADEPTNDLDPYWAGQVIDFLERAAAGNAVVMVTHHSEWAKRANRRYKLSDGGLLPC